METAKSALDQLLAGNRRFAAGTPSSRPHIERVRELAGGQSPFATVLACADSRVPVETLFDRDPGDIFVVRLAGNFVSDAALASIEYAVSILKSPLVMVLGHTSCGAVKAAIDFLETERPLPGHMQIFATAIEPAARAARGRGEDWWADAVAENVRLNAERLRTTPILREALAGGGTEIAGAVYDLRNGEVRLV